MKFVRNTASSHGFHLQVMSSRNVFSVVLDWNPLQVFLYPWSWSHYLTLLWQFRPLKPFTLYLTLIRIPTIFLLGLRESPLGLARFLHGNLDTYFKFPRARPFSNLNIANGYQFYSLYGYVVFPSRKYWLQSSAYLLALSLLISPVFEQDFSDKPSIFVRIFRPWDILASSLVSVWVSSYIKRYAIVFILSLKALQYFLAPFFYVPCRQIIINSTCGGGSALKTIYQKMSKRLALTFYDPLSIQDLANYQIGFHVCGGYWLLESVFSNHSGIFISPFKFIYNMKQKLCQYIIW